MRLQVQYPLQLAPPSAATEHPDHVASQGGVRVRVTGHGQGMRTCGTTTEPKPVSISTAPMPWSMRRCRLTGLCLRHMSFSSFASTCTRPDERRQQGDHCSCLASDGPACSMLARETEGS